MGLLAQIQAQLITGRAGDESAAEVIQTMDGGFMMVGFTNSIGEGNKDILLVRYDDSNNELWHRTYGGNNVDEAFGVVETPDSGYVIVGITGSGKLGGQDIIILRTDAVGDTIWEFSYGGAGTEEAQSVDATSDGGYIIAGSTVSYGAGNNDVYLIKINSSGTVQWSKTFGSTDIDRAFQVKETTDKGFIIAGYTAVSGFDDMYLIKTDSVGDTAWTRILGGSLQDIGYSVIETYDGNFIVTGFTSSFGVSFRSIYTVKVDKFGNVIWSKTMGGNNFLQAFDIKSTSDSGYVMVGYTYVLGGGFGDMYILKFDKSDIFQWSSAFGGILSDRGHSVIQTAKGGYAIVGNTSSFGQGGSDIYMAQTNENGYIGCVEDRGTPIIANVVSIVGFGAIVGTGIATDTATAITSTWSFIDETKCYCDTAVAGFGFQDIALTVLFSDSSLQAETWYWDFGDGDTSTQQNPTHNYGADGTYNVCLVITNNCGSDSICDSVSVACVIPTSNFSWSDSVLTVSFFDSSLDATSVKWDFGDGKTSTQLNPVHPYATAGVITVCLTVYNVCDSATYCVTIEVCRALYANIFTYSDTGLMVQFTDISSNATSWLWNFGDGNSSIVQHPKHVYAQQKMYWICLTVTNNCSTDTYCDSIPIFKSSIDDIEHPDYFDIYPNPNSGIFHLRVKQGSKYHYVKVEVLGLNGQLVYENEIFLGGKGKRYFEEINLRGEPKGVYLVKIAADNNLYYRRIVIQ